MQSALHKFLVATVVTLLMFPQLAWAGVGCDINGLQGGLDCVFNLQQQSGIRDRTPAQVVLSIIAIVLSIAGVLAVGAVVYGGIKYITSAGDEKKAEEGKHAVMYAIIGLLIIGAAIIVVNLVLSLFT